MLERFAIGSIGLLAVLWTAAGVTPLNAKQKNPLAVCLQDTVRQQDVCETDHCRMAACQRAAQERHAKAILLIGFAHVYGKGISKDYVKAYMYFQILYHVSDTLDERQRKESKQYSRRLMTELKERMAPGDISRAETLAKQWLQENSKEPR